MTRMARARTPKSKKSRAAPKHDSLAITRAAPAFDELAQTREGHVVSLIVLLDAAERVISERGFARASVEEIAARAGVTADVFHAHFASKGALLRALNDRFVEQMLNAVEASTRTGSWTTSRVRDVAEIAVRTILEVIDDRQGLVRAFLAYGPADRALTAGLKRVGTHMTLRLFNVMKGCKDAKTNAPSQRTVGFSLLLSVALAHHCILVGEDWSGVGFSREEVAEEAARAISAYLTATASS